MGKELMKEKDKGKVRRLYLSIYIILEHKKQSSTLCAMLDNEMLLLFEKPADQEVPIGFMSEYDFFGICKMFPDLRIEKNELGAVTILPGFDLTTGFTAAEIMGFLRSWNREKQWGKTVGPSVGRCPTRF